MRNGVWLGREFGASLMELGPDAFAVTQRRDNSLRKAVAGTLGSREGRKRRRSEVDSWLL